MKRFKTWVHEAAHDYLRCEVAAWAATSGMAIAAALATALLLSGCSTGIEPSAHLLDPATLDSAQSLAGIAKADWPTRAWWTVYDDPELNRLIEEALQGSPDLRAAKARLARADAVAGVARGANLPSAGASASAIRERFTENYIYPPPLGGSVYTTSIAALNFQYELDFWGRNQSAIDAANASVNAAMADRAAAELALATSVTRAWFQLERQYLLHDVIEASIRQRQDILQLTNQRVIAGLDTNVELRQAEAGLPQARVDLMQVEEAMALTRNQIAALLGEGPDRGLSLGRPVAHASTALALPANLPAELVGRRADVVAARWRVEAAAHNVANAKAQFYPNLNLTSALGFISLETKTLLQANSQDESFGPAISLPIFQPALRSNLRGRDAEYDAAVEAYNRIVIDSLKDVADQVASTRAIAAQQSEQAISVQKTEQAYALALQRYQAGLGNYLTVLTAETAVLQERRLDAELKARVLDTHAQLVRALGGGFLAAPALAHATSSLNVGVSHE